MNTFTQRLSEGARTAQTINEGFRTGAIRQQREPMTADRYLLRDNAPTLRAVRELNSLGEHYRAACRRVDAGPANDGTAAYELRKKLVLERRRVRQAAEAMVRAHQRNTRIFLALYFAALAFVLSVGISLA